MTTFKRGDRVEHVENNHGFVMTVVADQYTSGAVLTEWPTGTRHTEWAKFLRHAEPDAHDNGGPLKAGPTTLTNTTSKQVHFYTQEQRDAIDSAFTHKSAHKFRDDDPSNPTPESDPNYANTIREDLNATVQAFGGDPVSEDVVNHPKHYTSDPSGIECIQITRHRNFCIGSAIKYLWRAGLKESAGKTATEKQIEDLRKSIFYIQDEIERLEQS